MQKKRFGLTMCMYADRYHITMGLRTMKWDEWIGMYCMFSLLLQTDGKGRESQTIEFVMLKLILVFVCSALKNLIISI